MPVPSTIPPLLRRLDLTTSPPERFSLLQTIIGHLLPANAEEAIAYLNLALSLSETLKNSDAQAWCHRHIGIACHGLQDYAGAYRAFGKARQLFGNIDSAEEGECLVKMGEASVADGSYSRGADAFVDALELYISIGDPHGRLTSLKSLGDLFDHIGDHQKGLDYRLQALRVAEESNDPRTLGAMLCDLAVTYARLGDHERSLNSFRQALDLFRSANARTLEVRALSNLTGVHIERGEIETALETGLRALTIYEALDDRNGLATMLLNLSNIHEGTDNLHAAIDMRMKAFNLFDEIDNIEGQGKALLALANSHRTIGEHHQAIYFLDNALRAAQETRDIKLEYECHALLSECLEKVGDVRRALVSMRRWAALRERAEGDEKRRSVAELQARFDLERKEKERESMQHESERLKGEMVHKTAELASATLSLVEKNGLINKVYQALIDAEKKAGKDLKPVIAEIAGTIKRNTNTEEDWEMFEERFEQVHGDFLRTLSARYPVLTPTELRVCALIRTGLNSAQIADMLYVTKKAIDTYRFRARQKFELDMKDNLTTFLTGI